jgi:hypothetical protein
MENTPVIYRGKPLLVYNFRDDSKNKTGDHLKDMYLRIQDLGTGEILAKFGEGHSFANAFVIGDEMHVFASEGTDKDWFKSIYHFVSTDLKNWKRQVAIPLEGDEHLFNCSVCRDDQGYVMAGMPEMTITVTMNILSNLLSILIPPICRMLSREATTAAASNIAEKQRFYSSRNTEADSTPQELMHLF